MGSKRPKSAISAVFGGLEIGLRCARYAVWPWIPTKCDLRSSEYHLVELKKSVITDFRGQKVGRSQFRVRHDAGVFRPNRRHQRNQNGEKTLKPVSLELSGQNPKIFDAKKLNQRPADECAIITPSNSLLAFGLLPQRQRWPHRRWRARNRPATPPGCNTGKRQTRYMQWPATSASCWLLAAGW